MNRNIEDIVLKLGNTLFKISFVILCNEQDAQDAVQESFCKYLEKTPDFVDDEHEKAWFIRITTNICKDMYRFKMRHPMVDLEELKDYCAAPAQQEIIEEVMLLPQKLKIVIYLFYIEGYYITEIADILQISESAVKKRLERGRRQLKLEIEGGMIYERKTVKACL